MTVAIDLGEMIRCVRRELNMRRAFYPQKVRERKMNAGVAAREIDVMEAILIKLETERGAGPLFAGEETT